MEHLHHRFCELFAQLGLPSSPDEVAAFVRRHAPLPATLALPDAPIWTAAQATLLREKLLEDADWAELVDQLDAALRHQAN